MRLSGTPARAEPRALSAYVVSVRFLSLVRPGSSRKLAIRHERAITSPLPRASDRTIMDD